MRSGDDLSRTGSAAKVEKAIQNNVGTSEKRMFAWEPWWMDLPPEIFLSNNNTTFHDITCIFHYHLEQLREQRTIWSSKVVSKFSLSSPTRHALLDDSSFTTTNPFFLVFTTFLNHHVSDNALNSSLLDFRAEMDKFAKARFLFTKTRALSLRPPILPIKLFTLNAYTYIASRMIRRYSTKQTGLPPNAIALVAAVAVLSEPELILVNTEKLVKNWKHLSDTVLAVAMCDCGDILCVIFGLCSPTGPAGIADCGPPHMQRRGETSVTFVRYEMCSSSDVIPAFAKNTGSEGSVAVKPRPYDNLVVLVHVHCSPLQNWHCTENIHPVSTLFSFHIYCIVFVCERVVV
ncbi:hypothetical protein BLNAU_1165 [Blattamonas nauphoetae]|uniref:Uncharacterized protein n=1 Tax=Blattamonas nauphoetae TaxID=2049346 RepID=A0ABQ9YKI5_9EUKA|nr:hypothetical protein BLNAU_1165 [Blattamonas nauphoetae]